MATSFKIDRGIPLADDGRGDPKYPWRQMQVGDSFLLPANVNRNSVATCANKAGKRLGSQFTLRKTPEGIRVWRLK